MSLMQMRNADHSELIVRSKRVFTSEDGIDEPRELAFYMRDGRIVSIGESERVIAEAPSGVPVTDYGDRFICPGFHDAHLHFFHTAVGCSPYMLMYMGKSEEDLVERTVEFARDLPADAWVVTQGWRDYRWTPRQHPTKCSLDRAFPDRPCAMYSGDGHTLWLNSAALDALGVMPDTEPPAGGSFDTFENGELTGIAHEAAAMQLLPRCLEWLGEDRIAEAYAQQMQRMAEQGITSMCDMSLMPMPGCDFIRDDVYDKLQEEGRLCVRAHLFPTLLDDQSRLFELQRRYEGNELLSAPGFKQFFDGVSSEHTAFLTEPYSNPRFPGDRGRLTIPAERMRELVLAAAKAGEPVRIHVIGDGAIHAALDIFEEARAFWCANAWTQHLGAPGESSGRGYRSPARARRGGVKPAVPYHAGPRWSRARPWRGACSDHVAVCHLRAARYSPGVWYRFAHHGYRQHACDLYGRYTPRSAEPLA